METSGVSLRRRFPIVRVAPSAIGKQLRLIHLNSSQRASAPSTFIEKFPPQVNRTNDARSETQASASAKHCATPIA